MIEFYAHVFSEFAVFHDTGGSTVVPKSCMSSAISKPAEACWCLRTSKLIDVRPLPRKRLTTYCVKHIAFCY